MRIVFTLNGEPLDIELDPSDLMVDVIRIRLGLTGARPGCLQGQCGSCTILFNGMLAPGCMIPAFRAYGADILTIEGLRDLPEFSLIERGFERARAKPCRFCEAGKYLSTYSLITSSEEVTDESIRQTLSGVWCRCTTHERLVRGIKYAATQSGRRRT